MKIRYLGPADRLVVGGVRIRRGEIGEVTPADFKALGSKQNRVEVIKAPRSSSASTPAGKGRSAKPKKE